MDDCEVKAQAVPVGGGGVNVTIISSDPSIHRLTCILDGSCQPTFQLSMAIQIDYNVHYMYCVPVCTHCMINYCGTR